MLTRLLMHTTGAVFSVGVASADLSHRAMCLLPGYNRLSGVVLDSLLGPADSFEYVSTTTPTSPPPTIS